MLSLAKEGFLAQFDRADLRNSDKVVSLLRQPWYDPNASHSIPYTKYTTGICWRGDIVSDMTGSFNDLTNPTARPRPSCSTTSRRRSARRT